MKAVAVFPDKRQVNVIDHPEPRITQPDHVKLRMLEVGICGTDREICSFQYGTPPEGFEYLILGHESLGEVVEVGSGVQTIKPGDLVVTMVRRPCTHLECTACRAGRQDFCFTGDYTERGIKSLHGFMTEFVVDDQRYMNVVPPSLREVGVLVEPLTIAEKGLSQVWSIQQRLPWAQAEHQGAGRKAVVLGAGPVGQLGAMLLVLAGFDTYVYSRSKTPNPKADLAESFGAKYISSEVVSTDQLIQQLGTIDLVYEAVGASTIAFDVMRVLGTNGIFVFTGVPSLGAASEVDTDLLMRDLVLKNQVVLGTVNASKDAFQFAIRDLSAFMERWPQAVRGLITGRYQLEDAPKLLLNEAGGIKNIVKIS